MTESKPNDVGALATPDLLTLSLALAAELTARLSSPDFLDDLPRFPRGPQRDRSADWGLYADDAVYSAAGADGGDDADGDGGAAGAEGGAPGPQESADVPPGVLPEITVAVERLARSVDASRTALAGHIDRVFDLPDQRREVLGLPAGKTAFRHAPDYLREHLHIDRREARRRVDRSGHLMATRTVDHSQIVPPRMPVLADSVLHAEIDTSAGDLIASTLSTARREAALADAPPEIVDEQLVAGERLLVANARDVDPETLSKICAHWRLRFDALVDPDGREPTDAEVNAAQGFFYRGRKRGHGLHRWEVLATDGQHEILQTVAAAASNPRALGPECTAAEAVAAEEAELQRLDPRSVGQKQLDGLVSALTGALALADLSDLPASGGFRPQVLVTIDHDSLLNRVHQVHATDTLLSQAAYAGPVPPRLIRQWACEADLIPVVLGGDGQVLDIGRAQRLFPRRIRQALVARDGGCAAPNCSIPALWCEAHHIDPWENGGPTSVENGVLLCSHHHHAVHADAWEISVRNGVPWFIPAPYLDTTRRARRNRYRRGGTADPPD